MIKCGLSNRYKVDPYGTEEILSEVSNSVAPKLTIDYGDEVQEAEFTKRPTKGSIDTNISPVAVLNSIKGNTVAWNQMNNLQPESKQGVTITKSEDGIYSVSGIPSSNFYAPICPLISAGGHKIVFSFNILSGDGIVVYDGMNVVAAGGYNSTSKKLIYTAGSSGIQWTFIRRIDATQDATFRLYIVDLTLIYGAGNEPTTPEAFEADYYKWFGKQLTYEDYDAGSLRSCKMSGVKTTDGNSAMIGLTSIPVTTLKGKLNGEGSSVVVFPDGMKKAGTVRDEIVKSGDTVKAIKRIGKVDLGTLTWNYYSSTTAFYSNQISELALNLINVACSKYPSRTLNSGNNWQLNDGEIGCGINRNSFYLKDSSMNGDASALQTALNGVYAYYELATPEEYILDDFNVEKIMLGSTEVTKVYLGNQLIFEESN